MMFAAMSLAMCAVTDGDSIRCGTERIRIVDIDAPELHSPQCPSERARGYAARDRLVVLLRTGFTIERAGKDRYGRTLARVRVNGRDVGDQLVREGLARRWAGHRMPWCPIP